MTDAQTYLSPGAKPVYRRGSTTAGCLCIHGFSAAPTEISWLGDHLHDALDMTTYTPRLAAHGTNPLDMQRAHWRDWYASVCDGYEILSSQCDQVYVAGISMGGLLALLLAADETTDITAAAIIATPVVFRVRRIAYARYLKWLRRMVNVADNHPLIDTICAEQERRGETVIGRTNYNRWSVSALAELWHLTQTAQGALPHITTPMTLLYTQNDHSVSLASIDAIQAQTNSQTIETHIFEQCGHIITQDVERDRAFQIVEDFFYPFIQAQPQTEPTP